MLMAVPSLSPVSTQTFIPLGKKIMNPTINIGIENNDLSMSLSMQSGTPSCNRSSMAVAPTTKSPFSMKSSKVSKFQRGEQTCHLRDDALHRKSIIRLSTIEQACCVPMSLISPFFFFSISRRSVVAFSYRLRHVRNFSSLNSADANSRHRSPSKEYLLSQE